MKKDILNLLALDIRSRLKDISDDKLCEIRMRTDKPLCLIIDNKEYFVRDGEITDKFDENICYITENNLRETMEYITNYSLYAFNDELKKGFITVRGGHRIGVCGKTVYNNEEIQTIRNIQSLNIRIAHEIKGCGEKIKQYLLDEKVFLNTLIISRPGMGKTTLLRDLVRLMSNDDDDRKGCTIGVVDERSEIASCYLGKPQVDIGMRTDVLDCCNKKDGMIMMVRAMRPDIIAVDEIGDIEDSKAIEYCSLCGCGVLATIHGASLSDIKEKEGMKELIKKNTFKRFVVCEIRENCRVKSIYNEKFQHIGEVYD